MGHVTYVTPKQPTDLHSRRALLGGTLATAAGALLLRGQARSAGAAGALRHLVWVWQFSSDGEPNVIGGRLRDLGLGILLKTHDGTTWMSQYDRSVYAVSGPTQVGILAS